MIWPEFASDRLPPEKMGTRKYKRFRQRPKGAREWLARIITTNPGLFAHWQLLHTKRLDTGSRMS